MRRKLKKLLSQLNSNVYFTESPVNYSDNYDGCKYFLCFTNTHKICEAYRTLAGAVESVTEILRDGYISDSNGFSSVNVIVVDGTEI